MGKSGVTLPRLYHAGLVCGVEWVASFWSPSCVLGPGRALGERD